ncbi:MAG: TonB-dependent receptor [Bacteroidetes bacterium]|nr:MAG: TonB-dependent receptor [Bacteroidota bacterium]
MLRFTLTVLMTAFIALSLYAQRSVTGVVTDGNEPLVGATVLVKGHSEGAITDIDGKFTVRVPEGATELEISYTGFASQTVNIDGLSNVEVVLAEGLLVDEVVVIGYGSRKRSELVGSSVQVGSEQLSQIPVTSVDQVLQGKVAGLTISATSGTPGSAQDIRIRGISSITAGNSPLFVIDGVPFTNPTYQGGAVSSLNALSSINANDIESITVLKDASATAVYGARGSNGVIVITTKSGRSGKTTLNLSTSYGFSNDAIEGPVMLTGAQREELFYESIYNSFGAAQGFTSVADAKAYYEANPNVFGTDYVDWNAAGRPEGNWADVITNKNAPQSEVTLSATGGDANQNFYASLGYYNAEATVIGSDFERISGSLRYSRSISENFRFDSKNTVAASTQDGLLEGSAYFASPRAAKYFGTPLAQPYNADGSINIVDILNLTNIRNPLWMAENDIHLNKLARFITNNSLSWNTPIPNLGFTTRVGIDFSTNDYKQYWNRLHGDGVNIGGYAYVENNKTMNYVIQNSLDYSFNFNRSHNFDLKVLQEYQKNNSTQIWADGEGFSTDGLTNLASASTPTGAYSGFTDWAIASYTAMLNYDFNTKYILSATYRREGSSRFHPDYRWGNFWSAGAAWNMEKEAFMAGVDFIDNLKLRVSYGRTGNNAIGINQYQALFSFSGAYGGDATISPSTVGNRLLSWEVADNFETGIDFGLFKNRINGVFSYFRRETKENLFNVPLSRTTGFSSQTQNIAKMENTGLELELSVDIIRSKDLNLTIGGNVGTVNNKVLELPLDGNGEEINITSSSTRVETGHIVNEYYIKRWAGVDPDNGSNLWYLNGVDGATTSNFNEAEQGYFGKSDLPTLTAGINLHVDFKGFFFDAYGYYAGGHMVFENWTRYTNGTDRWSLDFFNGINSLMRRWQNPGDVTDVAKVTYTAEPWRIHSRYLNEGDFFRLKNVTFGYTFPSSLTKQIKVDDVRIFVRGVNLYTWVKDDRMQFDPEVALARSGSRGLETPPVKTVMFGLNLKF